VKALTSRSNGLHAMGSVRGKQPSIDHARNAGQGSRQPNAVRALPGPADLSGYPRGARGGGGGGGGQKGQFLPRWSEGRSGSIVRLGRDILCRRVCLLAAEVLAGFALIDPARKQ